MKDWLIQLAMKWLFEDGLKEIEKKNYTTVVLSKMFLRPELKKNWAVVCTGIAELLADCADEASVAKGWK